MSREKLQAGNFHGGLRDFPADASQASSLEGARLKGRQFMKEASRPVRSLTRTANLNLCPDLNSTQQSAHINGSVFSFDRLHFACHLRRNKFFVFPDPHFWLVILLQSYLLQDFLQTFNSLIFFNNRQRRSLIQLTLFITIPV